jgi:hypothetical protein
MISGITGILCGIGILHIWELYFHRPDWRRSYRKVEEESETLTPEQETFLAEHDENVRLHTENEDLRAVLKELCELKTIKDLQGETPQYRERKPKAWAAAFACFKEYQK